MKDEQHLGLSFDELKALGDETYAVAFDKSADEKVADYQNDEEFDIIKNEKNILVESEVLPANHVFFGRLAHRAVLTAVAKMIDENNTRLAQQLKSLAPQSNEGKDI